MAAGLVLFAGVARTENPNTALPASLAAPAIVEQMLRHNRAQAEQLRHYQELRHYQVQYKGFSANLVGKMDVSVTFDAATGKSFRIVSQSGSKLLCDKVLKKAVDSEVEAAHDQNATALTPANYQFELAGIETVDGRPAYVLTVVPVTNSKFLYRGKIWVDAADFALTRIKAEPAKNPSFWIQRPQITFSSTKTGRFLAADIESQRDEGSRWRNRRIHHRLRDLPDRCGCIASNRDPLINRASSRMTRAAICE